MEPHQCPYTPETVMNIRKMAEKAKIPFTIKHLRSSEEAKKNGVHPYGTFRVLLDGKPISYYPANISQVKQALQTSSR